MTLTIYRQLNFSQKQRGYFALPIVLDLLPHKDRATTHFSFSISIDNLFMSVSLKSKERLSLMRLKVGRSAGRAVVLAFMGC